MALLARLVTNFVKQARRYSPARLLNTHPMEVQGNSMTSLKKWPANNSYELLFAKKSGLPVPKCPVQHSAIALRNHANSEFAVYGRQSPFDYSNMLRDGFHIDTRKDNEQKYLSPGFNFTAYPTGVFFKKAEIDQFLDEADKLINEKQSCNMINSNCYSYSATVMALSVQRLLARKSVDYAAVSRILFIIERHPLLDHGAIGVLNNEVVVNCLLSTIKDVENNLLTIADRSADEGFLLSQSIDLSMKIRSGAEHFYSNLAQEGYKNTRVGLASLLG